MQDLLGSARPRLVLASGRSRSSGRRRRSRGPWCEAATVLALALMLLVRLLKPLELRGAVRESEHKIRTGHLASFCRSCLTTSCGGRACHEHCIGQCREHAQLAASPPKAEAATTVVNPPPPPPPVISASRDEGLTFREGGRCQVIYVLGVEGSKHHGITDHFLLPLARAQQAVATVHVRTNAFRDIVPGFDSDKQARSSRSGVEPQRWFPARLRGGLRRLCPDDGRDHVRYHTSFISSPPPPPPLPPCFSAAFRSRATTNEPATVPAQPSFLYAMKGDHRRHFIPHW